MFTKIQFIKSIFIALVLFSAIGGTTASTKKNTSILSGTVYICTGPKARKFHSSPNCRGLNRCSGNIKSLSVSVAQSKGFTPCKICYR